MPLSKIQIQVLRLLASQRDPESYVARATPLNRDAVRYSSDIDVFHDREEAVTIHETILPLGPLIWAGVEKAPGFTPEGLIAEIRRNSQFPANEWKALETTVPLDPKAVTEKLRSSLHDAEAFVSRMPSEKAGVLFLENGSVILPDPKRLDSYQTHAGQRRGQWPSSPEIAAAMFERHDRKPSAG